MKRKIITIDEDTCNGCGACVPNCPEGAIQLIEGKARLVSDLFCDGLGACIGECPLGAITIEEREALPYDERRVMENIIPQGTEVIRAHLRHLGDHGQDAYLQEALALLEERGLSEAAAVMSDCPEPAPGGGCPGSRAAEPGRRPASETVEAAPGASQISHWPVQLHLVPAGAPFFRDADLLLSADCVAHAVGDFHGRYLRGRKLAIACPKLDHGQEVYLEKLTALIDHAHIRSMTVMTMEVPCCGGLVHLARRAAARAERSIPIRWIQVSVGGEELRDETVEEV